VKKSNDIRPVLMLNQITKKNPSVWKTVETVYLAKGQPDIDLPSWPDWCFIPLFPWRYIAATWAGLSQEKLTRELHMLLASVGTWRYSQGIYRFSPALYEALAKTELQSKIPADVLLRLPEWCVYVEIPGLPWAATNTLWGFWAFLSWEVTEVASLHIVCDLAEGIEVRSLEIGDFSLPESITRMIESAIAHDPIGIARWESTSKYIVPELVERYSLLVSLLLYICSDEPEFAGPRGEAYPQHPQVSRVKAGLRLFPANGPRLWQTGMKIGDRLEKERTKAEARAKEHKGVMPHLRRAHWHGFWSGPRKKNETGKDVADRKFSHRWLPPIFVGSQEEEEHDDE
jgi:hypothetical protein